MLNVYFTTKYNVKECNGQCEKTVVLSFENVNITFSIFKSFFFWPSLPTRGLKCLIEGRRVATFMFRLFSDKLLAI